MVATSKIIFEVLPSCIRSPFTSNHNRRLPGSATSSRVTSHGPVGQKLG